MGISSTEPSSITLSQTKYSKRVKYDSKILPKQLEAKRDGVIR